MVSTAGPSPPYQALSVTAARKKRNGLLVACGKATRPRARAARLAPHATTKPQRRREAGERSIGRTSIVAFSGGAWHTGCLPLRCAVLCHATCGGNCLHYD